MKISQVVFLFTIGLGSAVDASTFNEACYLARYPDVVTGWVNNGGKAIDHWTRHGQIEGRISDCRGMALPNPALPPAGGSPNTIVGGGAKPVEISVDPERFAGAVASLKWNGVEFINIFDHGRQLQTAVQYDGYGECNNPTEAGSSHDGRGNSTSKLLAQTKISSSQIANRIQMAYWSFRKLTGACHKGVDSRLQAPLSNTVLEKRISIGAFDDNQIIEYALQVTHQQHDVALSVVYELLTGYLNSEFKRFFFVSKKNGALNEYLAADLKDISGNGFPQGSYMGQSARKQQFDPVIMSNSSGSHAMGVYIPATQVLNCKSGFSYGVFHFNLGGSGAKGAGTNKWNLAAYDSVNSPCIVKNSRHFKVYIAVGALSEVHAKLAKLMKLAP